MTRMPALFIGHGNPINARLDNAYTRAWGDIGRRLPRPKAILAISAHWETKGALVTAAERPRTIHDFYTLAQPYFDMRYDCPGDPALARRIAAMLPGAHTDYDSWGLDHGAWQVLNFIYPEADIPVLQLSLDLRLSPQGHYAAGQALAPLRDEGVLILGSGNIVHNLTLIDSKATQGADWAVRFNDLVKGKIVAGDHQAIIDYRSLPDAELAAPDSDPEHLFPLFYVLGARDQGEPVEFLTDGVYSTASMTSVLVGGAPGQA